jgi:hypothetical protein
MPVHDYTAASLEARRLCVDLLSLSAIYDDPILPHGYGAERMATVASIVRARRLMTGAMSLADQGDGLEAALLCRSILEIAFTLGWFKKEPELAVLIWMLDDLRSTLELHEEHRKLERNERRRTRRAGGQVAAIARSETLGLLDRSTLYQRRKERTELERRIRALPRVKKRLRRLRPITYKPNAPVTVRLIERLPSFKERAKAAGLAHIYTPIYGFESRAVVHPNPLSVEQFLEATDEGVVVHAEPQRDRPDPYSNAAAMFAIALELASEQLPEFDLQAEVAALLPRVEGLRAR